MMAIIPGDGRDVIAAAFDARACALSPSWGETSRGHDEQHQHDRPHIAEEAGPGEQDREHPPTDTSRWEGTDRLSLGGCHPTMIPGCVLRIEGLQQLIGIVHGQ
jgi:hypothetical protein